jgi:hypothetical protein
MKSKTILLVGLLLLTTACTNNPKVDALTQPATTIKIKDASRVINKLAKLCDRSGLKIDTRGTNNITCSRTSTAPEQTFFSRKYGTDVRINFKFATFATENSSIRIATNILMGNRTDFDQNKASDLGAGGRIGQEAQIILNTTKKELEKE